MRYAPLLSLGYLLCCGCAALGTKSRIPASAPITQIRQVVLITSRISLPTGVTAQQADSVFVENLTNKLSAATGWKVTYRGEVEPFLANMDNFLKTNTAYQAI